jgi:hypothetical protein
MRRYKPSVGNRHGPGTKRANPSTCLAWCRRIVALVLAIALGTPGWAANPQVLPEDQIKAGFLFNFTRFVEWNQTAFAAPDSPLLLCVLDDSAMADLLTGAAAGRIVNGRSVAVRPVKPADELRSCQVLFLSAPDERKAERILTSVKGKPVLTVGESPGFIQAGGLVNFSVQDNKIRLELDLDSANRAGLKISAKLIAVSKLVSGSPGGTN